MNTLDFHAPLGHHIGCHRRVNAAGQQAHGPSSHTGGQSAGTGLGGTMDISRQVSDFHIDRVIRMMDVHQQVGPGIGDPAADFLGNGDARHGELLIGALGFHLEGLRAVQIITQISLNGFVDGIQILLTGTAAAQAHHAENGMARLPSSLHISHVVHRLDIDGGLHDIHIKFTVGLHPASDVTAQLAFKLTLIRALQDDLAQLHQKNFLHSYSFFKRRGGVSPPAGRRTRPLQ